MNALIEPLLLWHDDYGLGLAEIDQQHQKLFRLMNQVWDAVIEQDDTPLHATDLIRELEEYAQNHFDAEERFMAETGYPRLDCHKKAHDAFVRRLHQEKDAMLDGSWISISLLQFLRDWLISHILVADREYAAHAGFVPPCERVEEELLSA